MPKYKVNIKNTVEIGKFKSEGGFLNVTNPTKDEAKRIENAIASKILKAPTTATTASKTTDKTE